MIDLHCHMLPALDDGAIDERVSLAMARMAVQDGITHTVVTPHVFDGVYENPLSTLHTHFQQLQATLAGHGIPLTVSLGGEVHLSEQLMDLVETREAPTIGHWEGRPVMLVEMPHGHIPLGADSLLRWLLAKGVQPMIVHPERNKDVMRKPERIGRFVELGCLLQLTAGSLTGRFGDLAEKVAWHFVQNDWVTVVASDAHNTGSRPPVLSACRDALAKKMGPALAQRLTRGNAASLLGLADA